MSFYAAVMHHSVVSYWEELVGVRTLIGAKRKATRLYGNGYYGHVIHVVECGPTAVESGRINDLPTYYKVIGPMSSGWHYSDEF